MQREAAYNCSSSLATSGMSPVLGGGTGLEKSNVAPVVLKDRLLTDSVVFGGEDYPGSNQNNFNAGLLAMSSEHSYSIGNNQQNPKGVAGHTIQCSANISSRQLGSAGSDGDSMPESPLSLDDG